MQAGIFAKTFPGTTPLAVLRAAGAAGYGVVQYNMACSGLSALPAEIPPGTAEAVAAATADTGVGVVAVSATYNMIHPDAARREAGREAFAAIVAAAPRMGAGMVTVCTGSRDAEDQWRRHPDNDLPESWDAMVAEFRRILPLAERLGVTVGVEPELANVVSTAERARRLLDLFPGGPIRIVIDAANLFEAGNADSRSVVEAAVDLLGPDIALAHAKDRDAAGGFATAGHGVIDWPHYIGTLRRAGYDGALVTHGLRETEAASTARFLRRLIGA